MSESLSFRTILTIVTFIMTGVVSLMFDSTCFFLDCFLVLSFLLMCLSSATLKLLLHCLEVLNFSSETRYSGLPNRIVRF
jgi:hypothetical protein